MVFRKVDLVILIMGPSKMTTFKVKVTSIFRVVTIIMENGWKEKRVVQGFGKAQKVFSIQDSGKMMKCMDTELWQNLTEINIKEFLREARKTEKEF